MIDYCLVFELSNPKVYYMEEENLGPCNVNKNPFKPEICPVLAM